MDSGVFVRRKTGAADERIVHAPSLSVGIPEKIFRSLHMALTKAYEQFPEDDTLEAVCRHIMKGEPRKSQFFPWFSLAVERGLRLTRLYEYYMETMDCSYQNDRCRAR